MAEKKEYFLSTGILSIGINLFPILVAMTESYSTRPWGIISFWFKKPSPNYKKITTNRPTLKKFLPMGQSGAISNKAPAWPIVA